MDAIKTRSKAAAEWLAGLREALAAGATRDEILAQLRQIDPPAKGIEIAQQLGRDDDERIAWVTGVARTWAATQPNEAWQWLEAQGPRLEKLADGSLLSVMMGEMAEHAPELLIANTDAALHLAADANGIAPQVLAAASIQALIAHDGLSAARDLVDRWVREPQPPDIGVAAFGAIARELFGTSPTDASQWLESMPASTERNAALASLASDWVATDPKAALRWSDGLQPEDGRTDVIRRAFGDWVEMDAMQAADWLGERLTGTPPNAENDALIANLLHESALAKGRPDAAMHWTELVADPTLRHTLQEQVLLRWSVRDPAAAAAYVASSSSLTPAQKQSLAERMQMLKTTPDVAGLWFAADSFGGE